MFAVDTKKIAEKFTRHGGAFDRGSADSYYHRPARPHYFEGATYSSDAIVAEPGTAEYEAYMAGFEYNEAHGDKKDWG
jgi:hypothetical protein